jgi:hypothetical protein
MARLAMAPPLFNVLTFPKHHIQWKIILSCVFLGVRQVQGISVCRRVGTGGIGGCPPGSCHALANGELGSSSVRLTAR